MNIEVFPLQVSRYTIRMANANQRQQGLSKEIHPFPGFNGRPFWVTYLAYAFSNNPGQNESEWCD